PIAGLFFLDEAKGLLLGLHRTAGADEPGLLFNELIRGLPFYGDVFHGASPPFSKNKDRRRETAPPIPRAQGPLFRPCRLAQEHLLVLQAVALLEHIHAAAGIHQLLLARKERVALGTYFDFDVLLG